MESTTGITGKPPFPEGGIKLTSGVGLAVPPGIKNKRKIVNDITIGISWICCMYVYWVEFLSDMALTLSGLLWNPVKKVLSSYYDILK